MMSEYLCLFLFVSTLLLLLSHVTEFSLLCWAIWFNMTAVIRTHGPTHCRFRVFPWWQFCALKTCVIKTSSVAVCSNSTSRRWGSLWCHQSSVQCFRVIGVTLLLWSTRVWKQIASRPSKHTDASDHSHRGEVIKLGSDLRREPSTEPSWVRWVVKWTCFRVESGLSANWLTSRAAAGISLLSLTRLHRDIC